MKKFICDKTASQSFDDKLKFNIARTIKIRLEQSEIDQICIENNDGTRIDLDRLEKLNPDLLKEIHSMIKNKYPH